MINETVGANIVIGSIFWDGKSPHICSAIFYIFLRNRNTLVRPTDFSAETPARPAHRLVGHLGTTFVGRLWRVKSGGRCLHHPALYLVWRLEHGWQFFPKILIFPVALDAFTKIPISNFQILPFKSSAIILPTKILQKLTFSCHWKMLMSTLCHSVTKKHIVSVSFSRYFYDGGPDLTSTILSQCWRLIYINCLQDRDHPCCGLTNRSDRLANNVIDRWLRRYWVRRSIDRR